MAGKRDAPENRLDSWKEIAAYLNRTVRTVHRWERDGGLPVYRHGSSKASVYAYRSEVDEWLRRGPPEQETDAFRIKTRPWVRVWIIFVTVVLCLGVAAFWAWTPAVEQPPLRLVPLTTYPGAENFPSISAQGDRVAFSWNGPGGDNYDIYVKNVDGGSPIRLTTDPAADYSPAFSPDGRQIAFRRRLDIYVMPARGGPERKLATAMARIAAPIAFGRLSWSRDGKWLAFSDRDEEAAPSGIFLVSAETGERRRLTTPPKDVPVQWGDMQPAFSIDGRSLAFVRGRSQTATAIFVVPLHRPGELAGEPRRLTPDGTNALGLDWSYDNRHIFYCGPDGLMRIPADREGELEAVVNGVRCYGPSCAPRARRVVYAEYIMDTNIWRIAASGEGLPTRLIASTRDDLAPEYSPDGARIVFTSNRTGNQELWVSDSEGANPRQLTWFGGPLVGSARWSPDGKLIAFNANPGGCPSVFVVVASGGRPVRLTAGGDSSATSPAWSRDGRWIYFASDRTGMWQVWKMPAGGGDARQITRRGGNLAIEGPDGVAIYYSRENEKGIWRVAAAGGEEQKILEDSMPNDWAMSATGIYLLRRETSRLEFYPFGAEQPARSYEFPRGVRFGSRRSRQIAVSPDGRWILYMQTDREESDLVLAENFR